MTDQPADSSLPAWSAAFLPDVRQRLTSAGPLAGLTRAWAWGGSTGRGVRVAVIDSGIEADHPALDNAVRGGVVVETDRRTNAVFVACSRSHALVDIASKSLRAMLILRIAD